MNRSYEQLIKLLAVGLTLLCMSAPGFADQLRIVSWNLANLNYPDQSSLRKSERRKEIDFDRISALALELSADIYALQEVASKPAMERIFPRDRYHLVISDRSKLSFGHRIFTGYAFSKRRFMQMPRIAHVAALSFASRAAERSARRPFGSLRAGLVAIIEGEQEEEGEGEGEGESVPDIALMNVHLKSKCHSDGRPQDAGEATETPVTAACRALAHQAAIVGSWIEESLASGVLPLVVGDFNRRMNARELVVDAKSRGGDLIWRRIADEAKPDQLDFLPRGISTECWRNHYWRFVEHIDFVVFPVKTAGSLSVRVDEYSIAAQENSIGYDDFYEYRGSRRSKLSDHCPLVVDIDY